jgi:hypothetical protein
MTIRTVLLMTLVAGCGGGESSNSPVDAASDASHDGIVTDGASNTAQVTAHVLNGATPAVLSAAAPVLNAVPGDGNWTVSPNKMRLTLTEVQLTTSATGIGGGARAQLTDCVIETDLAQPGLAALVDCPFTVEPGTYAGFGLSFNGTYEVLIDDPTNGLFTDPAAGTKLRTDTAPANGAQFVTVTSGDVFGANGALPAPVTINGGDAVSLSIVISSLQFMKVTVASGTASFGWFGDGNPFRPGMTASFGDVAKLGYYVRQEIGTALSRNISAGSPVNGVTSVGVFYATTTAPTFIGMDLNGEPSGCAPIGVAFVANGPPTGSGLGGYAGLDSSGVLGWAVPTDNTWATYSAEFAMAEKTTIGEATTLKCRKITADPAPPGGNYASGAPVITTADYEAGFVLAAR